MFEQAKAGTLEVEDTVALQPARANTTTAQPPTDTTAALKQQLKEVGAQLASALKAESTKEDVVQSLRGEFASLKARIASLSDAEPTRVTSEGSEREETIVKQSASDGINRHIDQVPSPDSLPSLLHLARSPAWTSKR